MQYELKISGAPQDDGAIDLDRLAQLANGLRDIAIGAPPRHETVEQQLERQILQKGLQNRFGNFIGILTEAGQSVEDDLKMLTR
jgi:hypothetical protein